jgi:hypothetical protein
MRARRTRNARTHATPRRVAATDTWFVGIRPVSSRVDGRGQERERERERDVSAGDRCQSLAVPRYLLPQIVNCNLAEL